MKRILKDWYLGGGVSYRAEVLALIERANDLSYTIPSPTKLNVLNQFITDLNNAGILVLLDELKVYKYNDAGLQNWSTLNIINPDTYQSAVVGANMTYGLNGWLGGATSALNTNFIPSGGVNFTLNNASFGCYVYNDALNANQVIGSVGSAGVGSRTYMFVRFTATSFNVNVTSSTTMSTGSNATSVGLHSANRTSSTVQNYYVDGSLKQSQAGASSGTLSDRASYVCGYNNNGSTVANTTQGISMNYHGANLTSYMTDFNTAWAAYLASI